MLLWDGAWQSCRGSQVSPLMCYVDSNNVTHYVCHFLFALLCVPLTTEEMVEEGSEGILML